MLWLSDEVAGREFMPGDVFTMADIIAETTIDFAHFVGIDLPHEAQWPAAGSDPEG